MSKTSPLIRLIPLQPSELPAHPDLSTTDSEANRRPDLLPFTLALLDQANAALHPTTFNLTFKTHSRKPSPPSNTEVEALTASFSASEISRINWSDPAETAGVGRNKPRDIPTEYWFARRSYHTNTSSKINPATASWEDFVFGLRDNHSLNEQEFTPTLYDARHILDWNTELTSAAEQWRISSREGGTSPAGNPYTNMTLSVYEMCHEVPFPLQPRCFPVLVATASTSATRFIAVTVPLNLTNLPKAFYSTERNRTEGEDSMRKKPVVLGMYTAIEACELSQKRADETQNPTSGDGGAAGEIEWIMGTASDAKGNLPMYMQRQSMPSMVPKDVGFFLDWIRTVDEDTVKGLKKYDYPDPKKSEENGTRKRSRTSSNASREMLSSARSSIEKAASLVPP